MNQSQQMREALGGSQDERMDVETLKNIRAALQSASIHADILSTPDTNSIAFVTETDSKTKKDIRRVLDRVKNLEFLGERPMNVSKRVAFIYKVK